MLAQSQLATVFSEGLKFLAYSRLLELKVLNKSNNRLQTDSNTAAN
jgi:hypothetical protein